MKSRAARTVALRGGPLDGLRIEGVDRHHGVTELIFRCTDWFPSPPHDVVYRLDATLTLSTRRPVYVYAGESTVCRALRDMKTQRDEQARLAYAYFTKANAHWQTILSLQSKLRTARQEAAAAKRALRKKKKTTGDS